MITETFNILLVEDNPGDARLVQEMLRDETGGRFTLAFAETLKAALTQLENEAYDAILLDLSLPDSHGMETFFAIDSAAVNTPTVVLSGLGDEAVAVQAVQEGAQDYLVKGEVAGVLLGRSLHYAIERHRVVKLLQQTEERLEDFLEHTYDLVQSIDSDGRFRYVNRAWLETLGYQRDEIAGLSYFNVVHPDSRQVSKEIYERAIHGEPSPLVTVTFLTKNGEHVVLEGSVYVNIKRGELQSTRAILRNITQRHMEEERIKHLAHHDGLTGLPNRRQFNDRLEQIIIRSAMRRRIAAVMFLDLDHFKPINDNYGHHVGDLLLQSVADRILDCVREGDTVARIGGDEFAVILTDVADRKDIPIVAQKIINSVAQKYNLDDNELVIKMSVGVSVFPDDGDNVKQLLNRADFAMYQVKASGRNNYLLYADSEKD